MPVGLCEDRRPPGYFFFFLVNDRKFPSTGILKVYFIISLIKKEIILDFMLQEKDCLLSSLDTDLMFGFIPRKSKGSDGFMWYFFLGTIDIFFSASMDKGGTRNTKGNFKYFFNHGTFFCG